jgi:hypothetical protein
MGLTSRVGVLEIFKYLSDVLLIPASLVY